MTFWSDHYDAIYSGPIAVDARLIAASGSTVALRACDKTAGASLPTQSLIEMQTIRPLARVRQSELTDNGITDYPNQLYQGQLQINGRTWRIKSYEVMASPDGPGEVALFLMDESG